MFSISNNKNITLDIIKDNLRETQIKLINSGTSPASKAITGIDYLLERERNKYPSYEIWYFLLQNKLIFPWNWKGIISNPNITLDTIKENPNLPWEWEWISDNPNVTYEMAREINLSDFIDKYASKREEIEPGWDWDKLLTKNITWDIVKKYPDNWVTDKDDPIWLKDEKGTRWSDLSQNPNITMDIIRSNLLNFDNNKDNPETRWNFSWLSSNPNINIDIVKNNFEYIDNDENNPQTNWNWDNLIINPGINFTMIRDNTQLFIENVKDKNLIMLNPNITMEIIENNLDYFKEYWWEDDNEVWENFSSNGMTEGRNKWIHNQMRLQVLLVLQELEVFDDNIKRLIVEKIKN